MLLSIAARPVWAQSGYIAGSLSADVVRTGSVDHTDMPGSGEAMSFSLRTGGAITPRFCVELDFTRPSAIETEQTPDIGILADVPYVVSGDLSLPSVPTSSILGFKVHTIQRTTTITAAASARQEITPRFALVYLGGIAFARMEQTVTGTFNFLPALASLYRPTYETTTVTYTPGPMVGFEARVGLTDHVQLVPGIRMLSIAGQWIIRPAVGLGWSF